MPTPANSTALSRDELALEYLEQLPFTPYPAQEQALFAWFGSDQGAMVCAPTGTGKTVIAEAAAFEALHTGSTIYYTTPLIALTDQKFQEMQVLAERWGFRREDVGLVTGNRRVNPEARVLVVVAEILLNRLLQPELFAFDQVSAVVMDEFHSFADPERGIVWEFTLSLLPPHIRLLLLSATVGNAIDFLGWLKNAHRRRLELVQSNDRKVPLSFQWVPDKLLNEHLEEIAEGDADARRTPALVFCFNRDECWSTAEELKGRSMLADGQQAKLVEKLSKHDWSKGAGPKLKQVLMRGVGVHHAGLLPRYRRIVEDLFQHKLLSVCICTETLSAGINLPARSVVMPSLIKGPPGKQKVIDASSAHQIFGRAGRPQFDSQGYVYALPHEDDVRILRWREKYDQIPEDTRDPNLLRAKKAMKKKMPTRSPNRQYWNQSQFDKLRAAPPRELSSQGQLPWRMLAYMLQISPDVDRVRRLVGKRLMDPKRLEQGERHLDQMLRVLHAAGVVRLEPEPPAISPEANVADAAASGTPGEKSSDKPGPPAATAREEPTAMARMIMDALRAQHAATGQGPAPSDKFDEKPAAPVYRAERAWPTERLREFFVFRSVNPVYALYLIEQFALADEVERLQALESVLELPKSLMRKVRVPPPKDLPPGPLAQNYLDAELVARGLIAAGDLYPEWDPDIPFEERKYAPTLGEKLRMLFDARYPNVHGIFVNPVWAAGELLQFNCDFQAYISSTDLAKQEGLIFRHLLRLVLLLGEFAQVTPPGIDAAAWREQLRDLANRFTVCCREVDPQSTEYMLAHAADRDVLAVEPGTTGPIVPAAALLVDPSIIHPPAAAGDAAMADETEPPPAADDFGAGILDADD
jgi:superfamily II DNA/RNA helicase